ETMGVSRGALRESLRALEMVGVIETRTGSGSYIKLSGPIEKSLDLTSATEHDDNPLNLITVRKAVEPLSAKLAAENVSESEIKELSEFYRDYDIKAGEECINYDLDGTFHMYIASLSQNKSLIDVMKVLTDRMKHDNFWRFAKEKTTKQLHHLNIHIKEHSDIVEAIANHNGSEAEKAMKRHLRSVEKGLHQFF
ncbi:MAG: FadR family transcriptional regulator, partial [Spirochaetaceae bacterium]|nr:FadR family transcriptional regulator [Spirochaetaceae bacterium]